MTHTTHTCVSVRAQMSLEWALETILEPYNSHLLHYQQTEFTLSDTYQELSVIEWCQWLRKSQCRDWRGGEKKSEKKGAIFICAGLSLRRGKLFILQKGREKSFKGLNVFKKGRVEWTWWWMLHNLWVRVTFYMFSSHFKWSSSIKLCMLQQWPNKKRAKSGRTHRQTLRSNLDYVFLSRACMTGADLHKAPVWTEKLT